MYYMDVRHKCEIANATGVKCGLKEWHEKLAHQNLQYVRMVLKNNNIEVKDSDFECEGCLEGKRIVCLLVPVKIKRVNHAS